MKRFILSAVLTFFIAQCAFASEVWLTDLNKAKAQAKAEKKKILINFTGSDWCGYCIKLHKEVFSKPEFQEYARKNLVLVEADFPNSKPQAPALKSSNAALKKQFRVEGFPTLVILDSEGAKLDEMVGYGGGGVGPLISRIERPKKR